MPYIRRQSPDQHGVITCLEASRYYGAPWRYRMQPHEAFFTPFSEAGSNIVESDTIP